MVKEFHCFNCDRWSTALDNVDLVVCKECMNYMVEENYGSSHITRKEVKNSGGVKDGRYFRKGKG